jgi:hypothetical protein
MFSKLNRTWAFAATASLVSFCGSTLGDRIGLHGLEQWPLVGFTIGLVGLSYITVWARCERVKTLRTKWMRLEGDRERLGEHWTPACGVSCAM